MNGGKKELLKQLAQMGDVVLITNGNRINLNDYGEIALKTQSDAVLYFFQRLDIEMIAIILEDNRRYQNFEKAEFLNKLGLAFDEFIEAGDTYLNRYDGICNSKSCNYKSKGFSFIGNVSGKYFNLIVEIKNGVVYDICDCHKFKCKTKGIIRNGNVWISDLPF